MERLTIRRDHGITMAPGYDFSIDPDDYDLVQEILARLAAYEDTGLEPEEIATAFQGKKAIFNLCFSVDQKRIAHIQELFHAEQEGRLLELPCKIGGTLWMVVQKRSKITTPFYPFVKRTYLTWINLQRCVEEFGKTVFLTREEADAALEKAKVCEQHLHRRAIYLGFPNNDCFPYYRCPLCGCNFRGAAVHVDQKGKRCCPTCKQPLSGLD